MSFCPHCHSGVDPVLKDTTWSCGVRFNDALWRTKECYKRQIYVGDEHLRLQEQHISELEEENGRLKQRIKRLEEAGVWQPIETAPTDMTWVIGYDAKDGEVGTIIFDLTGDVNDEDIHYEWTDGMRTWHPTHWMPLPEPPKAKEAKP